MAFLAALAAMLYREGTEPPGPPGEPQAPHLGAEQGADEEASALFQLRLHQVWNFNVPEPTPAPVGKPMDAENNTGCAYGPWGFDLSGMMADVEPGRDFYGYANGNWLNRTVIPGDQSSWDQFSVVIEQAAAQVRGLLDQGAKDGTQTGLLYKSFLDEELVEQLGVKPMQPTLDRVRQIENHEQFAAFAGSTKFHYFGAAPFVLNAVIDPKDSEMNVAQLNQLTLVLPSRDYYLQPRFAEVKAAYQKHVATMLGLAGWPEPASAAADVVAFEDSLAQVMWDAGKLRDPVLNYNKMAVADLPARLPGFHWEAFMQAAGGVPQNATVIVTAFNQTARDGILGIVDVVNRTDIGTLRSWEAWSVVKSAAPFLPKAFVDADFEFDQKLSGTTEMEPRWKSARELVNQQMGDAVGKQYVEKFFPESTRAAVSELAGLLKQAMEQRIRAVPWMSDETKQRALSKVAALKFQVGYPEKFRDYTGLAMNGSDLWGNIERAFAHSWDFNRGYIGRPVDHGYWAERYKVQDVGAEYLDQNKVNLHAAILQPPFYDPLGDMAVNFGAIGAVVGHEITHGFDDRGRKFDAQGRLEDWWTPADSAEFDRRVQAYFEQYSNFTGLPAGMHLRPELTRGETIGDLGGLAVAYDALQLWLRNHTYEARPPLVGPASDGLEADRRFFLGWEQVWRAKYTESGLQNQVATNTHPPGQMRGGIPHRNIDAWYTAFNIKPDDPLYIDKALRARIW